MLFFLLALVKASTDDYVASIYDEQDKKYVTLEGPKTNLDLSQPCRQGDHTGYFTKTYLNVLFFHHENPTYSNGVVAQTIHWKNYELATRIDEEFSGDNTRKIFCPAVQYSNSAWTFGTASGHTVADEDQQKGRM